MATGSKAQSLIFKLLVSLILSGFFQFPSYPFPVLSSDSIPDFAISTEVDNGSPVLQAGTDENPAAVLHSKQELQLKRLEELVRDLSHLIARLESRLDDSEAAVGNLLNEAIGKFSVKESERNPPSVKNYNSLWTERFHFVSAVKLKSSVTCIGMLPFRDNDGGIAKYFAVGDETGRMHIFSRNGDASLEFDTVSDPHDASRITAMASYPSVYKNETVIVTGHENGHIVKHRLWETPTAEDLFALHVDRVLRFESTTSSSNKKIDLLQVQNLGGRKRYIMAVNGDGDITIFEEDGKVYGTASPASRPIAFLKQRLLFLSESGAGSLDLRTMKITEGECEGLNASSFIRNYVFDAVDRSRAFGFTSEGDLIQTILLGDSKNFKCRIRSKRKLDLDPPLALQTIKGYLLITDAKNVILYNVSSQNYVRGSGVKPMFSVSVNEIASSFTNQHLPRGAAAAVPLIATDGDRHVLVHVGGGRVALFRSKLPGFRNGFNSILWTSPVLFFVAFLFGAWHFFANKKEALTSWGPDDLFNSDVMTPPPPSSSSGADDSSSSSRNAEIVEPRGGPGLRYVSPQRYGGAGMETSDVVMSSAAAAALKFRGGSTGEAAKRRGGGDGLFGNR